MPQPSSLLGSTWSSSVLKFTTASQSASAYIRFLHKGFCGVYATVLNLTFVSLSAGVHKLFSLYLSQRVTKCLVLHFCKAIYRPALLPPSFQACLDVFSCLSTSPAVIDQKYSELFTFIIKAWNFARLQPTLRLTFLDIEPSQIQHWKQVLRRP